MKFLRKPQVKAKTGLPFSTMYEKIAAGEFPRPIKLSDRCSAWIESEVEEWQRARVAERDGVRQ
jgi:prophage regulatory protein